ncbi:MAG TPA: VWA domain-containing protein [Terriglobales bacterium]|jgi:VWFA-related protein
MWKLLFRGTPAVLLPALLLLIPVSSRSQGQAAGTTDSQPPLTIRVQTRLVLVDVVVTDNKGSRVTDLRPEDFTVQEKGKTQKVAFFSPPKSAAVSAAPQLGPGIYSNRPEFRSPGGPVTVILLDAVNTPFKDQAYARQQMLQFLQEQLKPDTRMAVFTLTNSLRMLQDFTSDPKLLIDALKNYQPKQEEMPAAGPPAVSARQGAGDLGHAQESLVNQVHDFQNAQVAYQLDRRVGLTLQAMRALGRMLGGLPGRKNIIWVTAAFPFSLIPEDRNLSEEELAESLPVNTQMDVVTRASGSIAATQRQSNAQEIREVAASLASSQIAIYPVDARGLVSGSEATFADLPSRRSEGMAEITLARLSDVSASQETMKEMARETGGKAYVNQNEIKQGAALAISDNSSSYTLGYYPEDKKWNGKYRSIKVKVNRDGLDVRYRRGYYAIAPGESNGGGSKDKGEAEMVAEALQDRAPDTQVTFSAQVKPAGKDKLGIDFLVDPHTIAAEDGSGGAKKLNVVFYATLYSADGRLLANQSMKVDQVFPDATYRQLLQQGMLLHLDLDSKPGSGEIRLAVRDNQTGYIGTLVIPQN